MKLASAQVAAFLRNPGTCRVVLFYGDDAGMARERATTLVREIAGSLDDPFRVTELSTDELPRLSGEAASLSMTGGRRVVRVRGVGDAATVHVRALLKAPGAALVVLEAGMLPSRSSLRQLLDAAPDGATIACFPEEGRALEQTIRDTLQAAKVAVDPDALAWLGAQLGGDRASTRGELEKLALYAGPGARVDLDSAMACVGDLAGLSLDDALFAATEGDVATADRALELAMAEGAAPVQILRVGIAHLQKLHRARLAMDASGMSAPDATRAVRPPLLYRRVTSFARALGLWSSASLAAALAGLADAERNCKRTGWPDGTLSRNAIVALARRAASGRRGGAGLRQI